MSKSPEAQIYIARGSWVAGQRTTPGDELRLTPEQARYEPVDAKQKTAPRRSKSDEKAADKVGDATEK
ncbi:MAG: hypothetical protein KDJ98_15120 [Rhodobacteraceae bacterium]|nr:hypothetical protein [Paracoccaceae bacterium]